MQLEVTLFSPLIVLCLPQGYPVSISSAAVFGFPTNILLPFKCTPLEQAIKIMIWFWFLPGIVVTNDGNAILRELDLAHPAAKA